MSRLEMLQRSRPFRVATALVLGTASFVRGAGAPNVVLVLSDDLAWSDLACYGHPWHDTPHLDSLAREGLRFTNAYAPAPICSASRAAILTGRNTARLNFEFVTKNRPGMQEVEGSTSLTAPPYTLDLPLEERTIPECLGESGYETAFFGKWHVNAHHGRYLGWSPTHGPRKQGFQVAAEDFGSHPYGWGKDPPKPIAEKGRFPADSMIERAERFVRRDREKPFFLMVSQYLVHTPVRTPCTWLIEKYERRVPRDATKRALDIPDNAAVSRAFKAAVARAEIPPARSHDLRSTAITEIARSGVSLETVARLTGHSDVAVTARYYRAIEDDELREAVALRDRLRPAPTFGEPRA